jgi:hypothetical protein
MSKTCDAFRNSPLGVARHRYSGLLVLVALAPTAFASDGFWGTIALDEFANSPRGSILRGFNFNDLAGNAMTRVPDIDGDGDDEVLIAARFAKPFLINDHGVGFGEAYMIYGGGGNNGPGHPATRLAGVHSLNAVGRGNIQGLGFPGIRMPMTTAYTCGISEVAFIPDMDGDGLPELVFCFPRVESLSLGAPAFVNGIAFQHPELVPDLQGMGNLEYDAIDYGSGAWNPNVAQFVRGGVVIVSSQNSMLKNATEYNRKSDRLIDLHEVGQLFDSMSRPSLQMYARKVRQDPGGPTACEDCDPFVRGPCGGIGDNPAETEYENWLVEWDNALVGQGPGGFHMPWTDVPADPPLANPSMFPFPSDLSYMNVDDRCGTNCVVLHFWYAWYEEMMCMVPLPWTNLACYGAWMAPGDMGPTVAWTGFAGPEVTPTIFSQTGDAYPAPVGARILGQSVEDRFGTAVSADSTWLYISAPSHTVLANDVPALGTDRPGAGVVYQYRVYSPTAQGQPTRSQLWIEPAQTWPHPDREIPDRLDYTMPVPHQYIIETIGSIRGNPGSQAFDFAASACTPAYSSGEISPADEIFRYEPYPVGTAGYYMDRTPQIVGPHDDAHIGNVRALGDLNDDGIPDIAVGSPDVRETVVAGSNVTFTGPVVGSIFIVFGRNPGLEGDYLLDRVALDPGAAGRLHGVLLQGTSGAEKLARVFDDAGDFNGDGIDDVIVGSEGSSSNRGAVVVIFGSPTLESPAGGWTIPDIVSAGRAVGFIGENVGDLAGANVAGVGDVNGDGLDDVLIAAPGALAGTGVVYLIYGSSQVHGGESYNLADIGTILPLAGARFVGRSPGDQLGGGEKTVTNTDPNSGSTMVSSRAVARLGDGDGDGFADFAISAMLASPDGKTNAGEIYLLYGGPTPALADCNSNGVPDEVDIANGTSQDCNENGVPDECDIASGTSSDCQPNGVPDECDINSGVSLDCNGNGIPDLCDVESGFSEDCDGDEIPDECEVAVPFSAASGPLEPIGQGSPQSFIVSGPPAARTDVTLTFEAVADLGALAEWIDVDINGISVGRIFMEGGDDCPPEPDTAALLVPLATYNGALGHGDVTIHMVASAAVDPDLCAGSYIQVTVEYVGVGAEDCNANGVPDLCDILTGTSQDANGNGIPDECETRFGDLNCDGAVNNFDITPFVKALTATPPDYPEYYALYPDCDRSLGDVNGDGLVNNFDITPFVHLLTGG